MNSNLFDRKKFLEGSWIATNTTEYFAVENVDQNLIINVNLIRATANESESFKLFLNQLSLSGINNFVIDLSHTNFIDSTFLSTIISYNKKFNLHIKLVIADKRQLSIFKITKIDSLFNIYSTVAKALKV